MYKFDGTLGYLSERLDKFTYPDYKYKGDSEYQLFCLFLERYLLDELNNGLFITKKIMEKWECPWLRKRLLDALCCCDAIEKDRECNTVSVMKKLTDLENKYELDPEEVFELTLERDIRRLSCRNKNFDIHHELLGFSCDILSLLMNADSPEIIEKHKNFLKYFDTPAQIIIMRRYAEIAPDFYEKKCCANMPTPDCFMREFVYGLFEKDWETGRYLPIFSEEAIANLLVDMKRSEALQGKAGSGEFTKTKHVLEQHYDFPVKEWCRHVVPYKVVNLDNFGLEI